MKNRIILKDGGQKKRERSYAQGSPRHRRIFFSYGFSGRMTPRLSRIVSTRAFTLGRRLSSAASATSARSYATALLIYGILTVILNLGADFFDMSQSLFSIVFGAVISIASVLLFLSDNPIGLAISESRIADFIVYEFFCIKRPKRENPSRGFSPVLLAFFALTLSVVGFLLPEYVLPTALIGIFLTYFSFISPEFPLFLTLSTLPILRYIPRYDVILAVLTFIMALSFLRKVAFGKRTYNFEPYDLLVLGIITAVLLSGIFFGGVSSFFGALTFIPIALAYSVTSNVALNRRLCDSLLGSVIFSSAPTSIIAVVEFLENAVSVGFAEALSLGVSASFDSAIALSAYLTVSVIFTLFYVFDRDAVRSRAILIIHLVLQLSALALAGSLITPIALASALLLVLFAKGFKKGFPIGAFACLALPTAALLLLSVEPLSYLSALVLNEAPANFILRVESALSDVVKSPIFGGGVGFGAKNLPMLVGLAVSVGVFAPLLLLLIIALRIFHIGAFSRYLRDSHFGSYAVISLAAIVALFAFGSVYFVLSDGTLSYLFFVIFALGGASCRGAKESDDALRLYYHYSKREYSATVDVLLDRR